MRQEIEVRLEKDSKRLDTISLLNMSSSIKMQLFEAYEPIEDSDNEDADSHGGVGQEEAGLDGCWMACIVLHEHHSLCHGETTYCFLTVVDHGKIARANWHS